MIEVRGRDLFLSSSGKESDNRRCSLTTWLADVQAVLSTTPERGPRLISTLPIEMLTRPPAVGEWSALHCLQHLLDAERLVFPMRFHAFVADRSSSISIQTNRTPALRH